MGSTMIVISMFNVTNQAHWATMLALLLQQNRVDCNVKGYDDKLEQPAANATTTKKAAFKEWINQHGLARLTILVRIKQRIHVV
jgi:hypothetical protein